MVPVVQSYTYLWAITYEKKQLDVVISSFTLFLEKITHVFIRKRWGVSFLSSYQSDMSSNSADTE